MKVYQYANITDISADVANSSTDISASIILVNVMDFTDVPMLKMWSIMAYTNTNISIGASLLYICTIPILLLQCSMYVVSTYCYTVTAIMSLCNTSTYVHR